jgi:hypothetical protein
MTATPEIIHKTKFDARPPPPAPGASPAIEAPAAPAEFSDQTAEELISLNEDLRLKLSLRIAGLETRLAEIAGSVEVLKARRGSRGPAGPRGEGAAKIVSWKVNTFAFTATPIMSDGSAGADLDLREIVTILAKRAVAEAKQ